MKLSTIWLDGLWDRNPGLIQLLGLCPLLAVSNTLENAVGLGLATLFVLVLSNASICLRNEPWESSISKPRRADGIPPARSCAVEHARDTAYLVVTPLLKLQLAPDTKRVLCSRCSPPSTMALARYNLLSTLTTSSAGGAK